MTPNPKTEIGLILNLCVLNDLILFFFYLAKALISYQPYMCPHKRAVMWTIAQETTIMNSGEAGPHSHTLGYSYFSFLSFYCWIRWGRWQQM